MTERRLTSQRLERLQAASLRRYARRHGAHLDHLQRANHSDPRLHSLFRQAQATHERLSATAQHTTSAATPRPQQTPPRRRPK